MTFLTEYLKLCRPSMKTVMWESFQLSKGLTRADMLHHVLLNDVRHCCICNRNEDFLFHTVKLIPYFDMQMTGNKLCYVCTDHGAVTTYNCITGESIELPLPMPYWQRHIRDLFYKFAICIVIPLRFAYYFSHAMLMWYVLVYPMWWMKVLKRKLCDAIND